MRRRVTVTVLSYNSSLLSFKSCSSSTMANFSTSFKTAHHLSSTVKDCTTSSNVTSSCENVVAKEPARRRIVDPSFIHKHLGVRLKREVPSDTVINNEDKKKPLPINSIHKNTHLKQHAATTIEDSDQQKGSHQLSEDSFVINNEGKKKSLPINSIHKETHLKQHAATTIEDSDHKKGSHQLSDDSFVKDDENARILEEYSLPRSFGKRDVGPKSNPIQNGGMNKGFKQNKRRVEIEPFDICWSESQEFKVRRSSSGDDGCAEMDSQNEGTKQRVLRPGMVLLKNYITLTEQVLMVNKCRELGLGSGGFYRPGYKYGAKLRLYMMCLGYDWDPQTRKYQRRRQIDRSKPPNIPDGFHQLVDKAMQDSYALIRRDFEVKNPEEILPPMSPDVCIVNFYTENGRLGLHQDRDESASFLAKGLPVVSFSIGDSAEFLYGDERDINKADKVVLESGDVLIFGGESRRVFHGVSSIIPNSAPSLLLQETGLRPGRLNLTFRQV